MPLPPASNDSNPTIATFASAPVADTASAQLDVLTNAIASLGQLFQSAFQAQQTGVLLSNTATLQVPSVTPSGVCTFCGEPGHLARECEAVTEIAKVGKCKRNAWGSASPGAPIPHPLPH
jgi:hypothetical protein